MKRRKKTGTVPRRRSAKLKAITVHTSIVPKNYKPPSKPPRRPKAEQNVDHLRPRRYTTARGVKVVKLAPQNETVADYGDEGAPNKRTDQQ
jgi:hypothetical protein